MHKVSHETYNRRDMSNMQLNDGPHGAWAGACRTSSGSQVQGIVNNSGIINKTSSRPASAYHPRKYFC